LAGRVEFEQANCENETIEATVEGEGWATATERRIDSMAASQL
jgi:hypothetical protein